jgi:hypothetical protein
VSGRCEEELLTAGDLEKLGWGGQGESSGLRT